MELGFAGGVEDDLEVALLLFVEGGAGALELLLLACGVDHLDGAAVLELYAVLIGCTGGQRIHAKAGAGVIDLKEIDGRAGVVHDGDVDDVGLAGGGDEEGQEE